MTQGLVAGFVAVALVITARSLRPGETEFLVSTIRPAAAVAAVPALWVLLQVLPVRVLAHPIWTSLETALGHPVTGAISIDPGASVIALGQYLSVVAIGLVSAAVAVDRQRAEWILFALTGAAATIALILLADEFIHSGANLRPFTRAQAIDCASMGAIIASAACIRTVERYETRQQHQQRSVRILLRTFMASSAALVICAAALLLSGTREVLVATGSGITAFACMVIIRRFRQGVWYASMIAAATISVAALVVAAQQAEHGRSLLVTFAASPKGVSERVLEDAPLAGTGAGTFAAIAPIYREMDDPPPRSVASTAAGFAIELGRPMFWLISAATVGLIVLLLKASLQRGRDLFYPAMGGSCLITLMLLALINAGLLATATGLIAAATLGLAFAQSKSRTIQR